MLLRHPNTFAAAAAWDAPLMETAPKKYGMGPIFGTNENFQRYQIDKLLTLRAKEMRDETRLILMGYGNFRQATRDAHTLLEKLEIPHIYRDDPHRLHHWQSGWLGEAVMLLCEATAADSGD